MMSSAITHLRRARWLAVVVIACAAVVLRAGAIDRQGLWLDEVFSLAMATGHSLEHPASVADPSLGDFVEGVEPLSPEAFRRYSEHETPAAGALRVIRAVRLSDTSPPLYYLLLNRWLRHTGSGDVALRLFSLLWGLACLPLLWSLAHQVAGRAAAVHASVFFAFAPVAVLYSIEGRMYSMLWFLVLATAWLALRLHALGPHVGAILLLVAVSTAGLLTHYFYTFVWAAIGVWLFWQPGKLDRRLVVVTMAMAGVLALPWYLAAVDSDANWRITKGWLEVPRYRYRAAAVPFELAFHFFSNTPGGRVIPPPMRWVAVCLAVVTAAAGWRLGAWIVTGRRAMLWLWVGAACLGPAVVDLALDTYAGAVPRYALAGLPAAFLIVAAGLSRLSPRVQAVAGCVIVLAWIPGLRGIYTDVSRGNSPLREMAHVVNERNGSGDLMLVQSIPSGVVGLARYLEKPIPMAAWVGQLGQRRVPDDLERLAAGHRRIVLVQSRANGTSEPEHELLERAFLVRETRIEGSRMLEFEPRGGNAFFGRGHLGTAPGSSSK